MPPRRCRIVVAGAGPVGLLFAVSLIHRLGPARVDLRLLDAGAPARWRADAIDPRVYALSRESQGLLGESWAAIAARRLSPYRRMRVFEGTDPDGPAALDFDAAGVAEPDLGHIVEDSLIRSVLLDELGRLGVETSFATAIDSIAREGERMVIRSGDDGRFEADLLVGADGAESRVRTAAGIDSFDRDYAQRAIVSHVTTARSHRETAWQRFLPGGPLAFLPLADGRSSIVWTNAQDEAGRLLELGDEEFIAELERASAGVLGRIEAVTPRLAFSLKLRHAMRYTRPGIALIGDAAHSVHPLAGQGMNLGLRDAAVLAETLADALDAGQFPGDDFVLRRYARAQQAHNVAMQLAFDGLNTLFGPRLPGFVPPLRRFGMAAINRTDPAKRLLMRRALGLDRQ